MDNGTKSAKVKMSGYLQMKSKKRMLSSWKSYWFVLEDRLLLFYRSKAEYEAISPCKGSINLGPPCVVKSLPSVTNGFQIETRTVTYTLKAENSDEQKKWIQNILIALKQNQNFTTSNTDSPKRLSHFRYSLDDLVPEVEPNDHQVLKESPFKRQNTMPHKLKLEAKKSNEIIERLQKMGAHSYGGSLGAISKIATKKVASPTSSHNLGASKGSLPDYCLKEEEEMEESLRPKRTMGENIYERISGDSQYSDRGSFIVDNENYSIPIRKSVQDSECSKVPQTRETKSLLVENDQYQTTRHVQSEEVIYAEPKVGTTDCNKNSVIVENSFYACADVTSSRGSSVANENVYEDLDKFSHYSQPVLKNIDEHYSSQSSIDNRNKKEEKSLKKSKSFIKRMWKKKNKKFKEQPPPEEDIYAEVDVTAVEKVHLNDESAIQMLSELHNILETKKSKIMASSNAVNIKPPEENLPQATSTASSNSDLECPTLPPKTHKMYQDTKVQFNEEVRSLDEILEDLDKEKLESKSKVQMLIEKFSETDDEDVVLRKHNRSDSRNYRDSEELNKLLDELVKVTSAPIMTPGVTSSLVNPNLTDDEWLKFLPVRQRRLSEPDYDVPRPHKPIQTPEKSEKSDAIPATRFFGPALPTTLTDNKEDSLPISMTPDSLEVDELQKFQTNYSYTSHNYYNDTRMDLQPFSHNYNPQDDKIIYAMPKSYISVATHVVNTCRNICVAPINEECTVVYKNVKNFEVHDEIFKDSLEATDF